MNAIEVIQSEIDKREREIEALKISLSIISGEADVRIVKHEKGMPEHLADEVEELDKKLTKAAKDKIKQFDVERKYQRWTSVEDKKLKGMVELGLTDAEIAEKTCRTEKSINVRRSRIGAVFRKVPRPVAPKYQKRKKREQGLKMPDYEPKTPGYEKPIYRETLLDTGAKHHMPWSKGDVEYLKELDEKGFDNAKIASEMGRTKEAVSARRHNMGMSKKAEPERRRRRDTIHSKWTKADDQMLVGMRVNGYSPRQIGTRLKRSTGAIKQRIWNFKSSGRL